MSWTDERVALLKKLWGEGKTAAEIAKELGGVTRNAVIGKAHRLKLSSRVSPIQQNNKKAVKPPEEKPVAKKIKTPEKIIPAPASNSQGVNMAELKDRMCRWPLGDPKEPGFLFCGGSSVPGMPYCSDHAKVAYQAATRNRLLKAEEVEDRNRDDEDNLKEAVGA